MKLFRKIGTGLTLTVIIFALIFLFFFINGVLSLDPDFGWHLTSGRLTLIRGVAKTDPFSYTMPSFPFVDHEWLTNVLIAKTYPLIGKVGLSLICAAIATAAILISLWEPIFGKTKETKIRKFLYLIPSLLGAGTLISFFGVRPQVESWLLLAVLVRVITSDYLWKKFRFFIPLLILLWTNLHGSFALSLALILVVAFFKSIRLKRVLFDYFIVFTVGVFISFINPYGPRLWGEVWMQLSDSTLRWRILEWMPPFNFFNLSFIALLVFSLMLTLRYRRKVELEFLGLYAFLLLQAVSSSRHIPLWVIVTMPLTAKLIQALYDEVKTIKLGKVRFIKLFNYMSLGAFLILFVGGLYSNYSASFLSERYFYPKGAVAYLKGNLPKGQIFSEYGWGGYLIWKLPEKRVFIDGRMPSWRWNFRSENESAYAMNEYLDLINGELDYRKVFDKFGVTTVLWPTKKPETFITKLNKKLKNFSARFLRLVSNKKNPDFDLIETIEQDGWVKVYSDSTAEIYERK
jgi:hypothetical protein